MLIIRASMTHQTRRLFVALVAICLGQSCNAAQFEKWGDFEIHYTTLSSMLIPREVAAVHDITRADNRIVINISVKKSEQPVAAVITGQVINLLNQMVVLEFREVKEANAIYYLASHTVDERDTLKFEFTVAPDGETPYRFKFMRRYY